jgi:NAD-dependent DNA ligase
MTRYFLKKWCPPTDAHGQPTRLFKANLENNISKSIDRLSGICEGVLADGVVNDEEAKFFAGWVREHAVYEPVWPMTDILTRVDRIFADGHVDDEEREELRAVMSEICGHVGEVDPAQARSSRLPLDDPEPPLVFAGRKFHITGRFAFGTRVKVFETLATLGAMVTDSPPNREAHYLVIGTFASRDWIHTSFGRKIERAVELREMRTGIAIVSEEHWRRHFNAP